LVAVVTGIPSWGIWFANLSLPGGPVVAGAGTAGLAPSMREC